MKVDLHLHTNASIDSAIKAIPLIKKAKQLGFNALAITDHETINNALKIKRKAKKHRLHIIIGQEIKTEYGDIIALFIKKEVRAKRFLEAKREIRKQKGLVVLPHPFQKGKLNLPPKLLQHIDLVEVFNSRVRPSWNEKAKKLALQLNKPMIIGSDAHFNSEFGQSSMIIEAKSFEELKENLIKGKVSFDTKSRSFLNRLYFIFRSQITQEGYLRTIKKIFQKKFRCQL